MAHNLADDRQGGLERHTLEKVKASNPNYIVLKPLLLALTEAITDHAHGRVLDVGCGNKPYASLFRSVETYVGCDVVQSSEGTVDVLCQANSLPFENESFHTVFTTQVMEHVADVEGMMSEMARVLKPGGKLILSVPMMWQLHEQPYDFQRFTHYGIDAIVKRHGLETIYINPNGGKWAAAFQILLNNLLVRQTKRKPSLLRKAMGTLLIKLNLIVFYNWLAIWIDKKYFDDILTLNYVATAVKPL